MPTDINKDGIISGKGYCKNSSEEKYFWSAINKFSNSFLFEVPAISPDQKAYLESEFKSGNNSRMMQIQLTSMYKMNDLYTSIYNLKNLSDQYLKYQGLLTPEKRMEIIGRSLMNLIDERIDYSDIKSMPQQLSQKGYIVSSEVLLNAWVAKMTIKRELIFHLICYGENK